MSDKGEPCHSNLASYSSCITVTMHLITENRAFEADNRHVKSFYVKDPQDSINIAEHKPPHHKKEFRCFRYG